MARMPAPVNLNSGCISSSLDHKKVKDDGTSEHCGHSQLLTINTCSSSASTSRITSLDHKILFRNMSIRSYEHEIETNGYDAMEHDTIVVSSLCEFCKVFARLKLTC